MALARVCCVFVAVFGTENLDVKMIDPYSIWLETIPAMKWIYRDIGSPDLNSIALDDVERIEVVQGSAGVLFGDQAVGGVINIITRKPGALRHSLKLSAGSYNTVSVHAMTSQALDNGINYRVSLDARESDNYRDHNELSYLNGFGKLAYDYSSGSVFAELQYIDNDLNTPGALFASEVAADRTQVNRSFATDYSNSETTVGRIGLVQELSSNWSFEGEVTSRKTDGDFRISFAGAAPSTDNFTQNRKIQEFTPRFIGFIPALNNTMLTIGADAVESEYEISYEKAFEDVSGGLFYYAYLSTFNKKHFT